MQVEAAVVPVLTLAAPVEIAIDCSTDAEDLPPADECGPNNSDELQYI